MSDLTAAIPASYRGRRDGLAFLAAGDYLTMAARCARLASREIDAL